MLSELCKPRDDAHGKFSAYERRTDYEMEKLWVGFAVRDFCMRLDTRIGGITTVSSCNRLPPALPGVLTAAEGTMISCSSKPGERQSCPADTSKGVILAEIHRGRAVHVGQDVGLR